MPCGERFPREGVGFSREKRFEGGREVGVRVDSTLVGHIYASGYD